MSHEPRRHAVLVGVFVTVGLSILAGGALTLGGITDAFVPTVHVTSRFADVGGLQKGDEVWFSGVPIGTVSGVRFAGGGAVEVELAIAQDATAYLHGDTLAKISSDGVIGSPIVVLSGGSARAAPVGDGDVLASEETTSTAAMLAMLQQNNANLLVVTEQLRVVANGVASGEGTVGRILADERLYDDLRSTVATLQGAAANAEQMTANLSTFAAKVNAPGSLPNDLVTDQETYTRLTSTVEQLEQTATHASDLVASLDEKSRDPSTPLGTLLHDEEAGADLKATLENLNTGSERLSEDLEAVQHNFLLRGTFKRLAREKAEAAAEADPPPPAAPRS